MLMRAVSRRRFLELAGGSVAVTVLSDSIARGLTIPANRATRTGRLRFRSNPADTDFLGSDRGPGRTATASLALDRTARAVAERSPSRHEDRRYGPR
jgi:hypothetical protein